MGADYIKLEPVPNGNGSTNNNHMNQELVSITAATLEQKKADENAWIKTQEQLILREIRRVMDNRRLLREKAKQGKNYVSFSFRSDKIKYYIDDQKRAEMLRNIQAAIETTGFRVDMKIRSHECEDDCGTCGGVMLLVLPFIGIPLLAYSLYKRNRYYIKCKLLWGSSVSTVATATATASQLSPPHVSGRHHQEPVLPPTFALAAANLVYPPSTMHDAAYAHALAASPGW